MFLIHLSPIKHVTKQIQVNIGFKNAANINWSKKEQIEEAHSKQSPSKAYFIALSFLPGFLKPINY